MAFTGGNGGALNTALYLHQSQASLAQRKVTADQIVNRLRPKMVSLPGATVFLQAGQDLRIGGRNSNAQHQYTIQSESVEDLTQWGPALLQRMKKLPGLTDVNTDQQNGGLEAKLSFYRSRHCGSGWESVRQLIDATL